LYALMATGDGIPETFAATVSQRPDAESAPGKSSDHRIARRIARKIGGFATFFGTPGVVVARRTQIRHWQVAVDHPGGSRFELVVTQPDCISDQCLASLRQRVPVLLLRLCAQELR
jgi:hypothetical protein